mmetsp:Transcript_18454/g.22136  ORF Transcript_18454/g.22136 Transcript_18454/m.22136 type:complete len:143 (+) Transcript_18454:307-735(+)
MTRGLDWGAFHLLGIVPLQTTLRVTNSGGMDLWGLCSVAMGDTYDELDDQMLEISHFNLFSCRTHPSIPCFLIHSFCVTHSLYNKDCHKHVDSIPFPAWPILGDVCLLLALLRLHYLSIELHSNAPEPYSMYKYLLGPYTEP